MIVDLLEQLGALGAPALVVAVGLLAFGESAILLDLFVPGEVGMVLAGAAAAAGDHPLPALVVSAAVGATAGDTASYLVGRRWGRAVIDRFALTRRHLGPAVDRAEATIRRRGGPAVFGARWVGALRAVAPFVAGMGGLRFRTFLAWNVVASTSWVAVMLTIGHVAGPAVAGTVDRAGTVVSIVVVAALAAWLWRRRRRRQRNSGSTRSPRSDSVSVSG